MSRTRPTTIWTLARAAGVDMNPTLVTQRANQFATATAGFDSTTLLLTRDDDGMHGYLITVGSGGDTKTAATNLAHAVGARADESEFPTDLVDENVVGWMVYESGSSVAREIQVGVDPTETARLLANTLPHGSWVAIVMRRPTKRERTRNVAWLSHRLSTAVPTHHSMSKDAVVVSIYAGGPDASSVRSLLDATRSAMPGFDIATRAKVATRLSAAAGFVATGLLAAGAGIGSQFTSVLPDLLVPGLGAAAFLLLLGTLRFMGIVPSAWTRSRAMASTGNFRAPRKRLTRPRPPRKAIDRADKSVDARDGDYPLHDTSFMAGPQVVIGVVAPQAGAVSGESTTKDRSVPPAMLKRIGPLIGDSDAGPAHISAFDAFGGVAIVGKAGSGKSVLTRSLFGWACLERVRPCGVDGFPGSRHALIAFESKGDGVESYQKWVDATGDIMVVIDLADPTSYGIDLFGIPGTVNDKANFFVNALKYAFGDGAIGDRSFETLLSLLPAALLVTPRIASQVKDLDPNASPLYYTHVLLGGRGDDIAVGLAAELAAESVRPGVDPTLREVVIGMGALYGSKVTPAQRRALQEAPRNKMRQLLELEHWWSPARQKVTWSQILDKHRIVVINTGTSRNGTMVEDELNGQMSAVLLYSLRHAIQRQCSGWQEQGRHVSIFADELSLLAGKTEAVVAWFKDQGRSFGVRAVFATQRPEQLSDRVRSAFMNFSTLVSFTQEDVRTAREIAEGVSASEGDWTAEDVLNLNPYSAIVRAHVNLKRQPAFTIRTRFFEGDRLGFAAEQGYTAPTVDDFSRTGVAPVLAETYTPGSGPVPTRATSIAAAAVAKVRQGHAPTQPTQPVDPAAQPAPIAPVQPVDPAEAPVLADPVPQRVIVEDDAPEDPTPSLMNW